MLEIILWVLGIAAFLGFCMFIGWLAETKIFPVDVYIETEEE